MDILRQQEYPAISKRTVDAQLGVANNLLDGTLLLEVGEGPAGKRAVDLETIDKGGDGDEAVRLNVLVQLVRGLLVEDDGVLGLVLDCGTGQWRLKIQYPLCGGLRCVGGRSAESAG